MRRYITIMMMILLSTIAAQGQIRIGGNVYGGGNHAEVKGSTKVTVKAGDIGAVMDPNAERPLADPSGKVFGGARMANVGGSSFVNIDGKNATDYILINQVFGGNDIAGQIGTAATVGEDIPTELTETQPESGTDEKKNKVDNTFNSYVRISTKATTEHYTQEEITAASTDPENPAYGKRTTDVKPDPTAKKVYIGQLFAGGNGDFDYEQTSGPETGKVTHRIYNWSDKSHQYPIAEVVTDEGGFQKPELDKTYLEIKGGSIVYGYGGGNNVTVKEQNIIHIDNPSAVVNHILVTKADGTAGVDAGVEADADTYAPYVASVAAGNPVVPTGYEELLSTARFKEMGINTTFSFPSSGAYQVGRFFGGNNKAEMNIQPKWNLLAGKVRNLYSGGNRGAMTSPEGLLLEIKDYSSLIVDNLYGGCRMADVKPSVNGEYMPCTNNTGYVIPDELAARTIVLGGHVNNVYGGNDVTGKVYGGNAVGIHTTVYGDVYGGGNGAYPYTDSPSMKDDDTYGDFYFGDTGSGTDALNAFRPNAEQVSIRLVGDANNKTVIKGSVFLGGNCASLATTKSHPLVELKIGSHVIADKVFLGNNGEKMVDPELLKLYKTQSDINLISDPSVFASYMEGVAMPLKPSIVFDNTANGDPETYVDYTSMIGSFYGGGNRGSMTVPDKTILNFDRKLIIFDKMVGGCNNANVEAGEYNAAYEGGLLGSAAEQVSYTDGGKIKDRLQLDLNNVVIRPQRWNDEFEEITSADLKDDKLIAGREYYTTNLHETKFIADGTEVVDLNSDDKYYKLKTIGLDLEWNTAKWSLQEDDFVSTGSTETADDKVRRLMNGNVYGGCYSSGHVNGNVVININQDLIERDVVFAETSDDDKYSISGDRRSGVLLRAQGGDMQAVAMTVFGAGYGANTEIWGSTTVNHNNGYAFQIFGGGEKGVVGNSNNYVYNAAYSTTVNLKGLYAGYSDKESAEVEYIYGGGNEGDVLGDSYVYLGNGRVNDVFGGASNADIYGGTEVHVGYNGGFPWIRENVYGGNDFGGIIRGDRNHYTVTTRPVFEEELKRSSTYVKYIQGRVDSLFGGNYGYYDYADRIFKKYTDANGKPLEDGEHNPIFFYPHLSNNSFVHFVPEDNSNNQLNYIFGGSAGYPGNVALNDAMQKETYVLIDDTKTKDVNRFANVDIYGGGAFAGVGTPSYLGAGDTTVDLFAGSFHNVYGGCNQEGLVGYTRVNVPTESTAKVNALFGGGKGYDIALFKEEATKQLAARYCDHYVTCIDFKSKDAIVNDAIYGGNENCRIACDTYINIEAPVMQSSGNQANIYGAGYGRKTLSARTNVFMNNGSNAYKVFGGGRDGNAFNFTSMLKWLANQYTLAGTPEGEIEAKLLAYRGLLKDYGEYQVANPISLPTNIGTYPNAEGVYNGTYTNDILPTLEKPMPDYHQTNVHIMNGGNVSGYAYGGGYGKNAVVAGSTYLELKGGNVNKDVYGGGEGGPIFDEFGLKTFTATTNVYIEGGMARNVYGGGYEGHVGKHCKTVGEEIVEAAINESNDNDIPGVANVTIGKTDGTNFYNGVPAIQRNVYGGGEGGSVYGIANLTINNGYIGYRYKNTATSGAPVYEYVEELDDQKPNAIELAGNAFGGGYVVNSYVDNTNVEMYGGTLRGSLYGGGEVGPVGRGTVRYKDTYSTGLVNGDARIYKAGKSHVKLYDGHVKRNVFGGGRGKDSWGGDGTMYMDEALKSTLDLMCKGYVFGQTEVDIYGGEVGTDEGVALGYGNVFGGGDIGCVYSAYELADGTLCIGKKNGTRYDELDNKEGYYYKYEKGDFKSSGSEYILTEDCKVLVEPWCKANSAVTINGETYDAGVYVPTSALNYLGNKTASASDWAALGKTDVDKEGVIIHNAVFAGGNTSPSSTEVYANTTTVFGNATASIHDVYNRDLISIGRGRVGGLYGDGNLTLVDGYRELNITNYGTDYYHITPEITLEDYNALPFREAAYYEIRYKCLIQCTDKNGKTYPVNSTITADEMLTVFEGVTVEGQPMIQPDGKPLSAYWKENGVCSRYAGRPLNTIQRADFCGVFGSRMVMQGAQDRVPETVDYTNYTINRVREVSLNKKVSVRSGDASDERNAKHGNYFGIYSVVNFLGALTSDVDFHTAVRDTENSDAATYKCKAKDKAFGTATYYDWKDEFHNERKRNNGSSHNKVALASGVYLELTSEKSTGKGLYEKDWGLITGVVELDLINVQPGMGGGYVYAKNEHGTRSASGKSQTVLTDLNKNNGTPAVTNKNFEYDTADGAKMEWETSGNFIHSTQTIIDDCYNIGDRYKGEGAMPAHYWFIKGAVYVYDQYISAYTGSPNAFSETVSIPLTITSASHGKMTLLNVMPNYYAYYSVNNGSTQTPLGENDKIELRDKTYGRNDAINYWDYSQLTDAEKKLFVDKTYVVIADCTVDGVPYTAGKVLLSSEYESLRSSAPTKILHEGDTEATPYVHHVTRDEDVDFDFVFRPSNNVSHDTGYILTYTIDNPNQWNTWWTPKSGSSLTDKKDSEEIKSLTKTDYEDGPTYTPNITGLYGQNDYNVGSIISKDVYDTYQNMKTNHSSVIPSGQATFNEAYIVTAEILEATTKNGTEQRLHKGTTLAKEDYTDAQWALISGSVEAAYVVTNTIQLSKTDYIYRYTYLTASEISALKTANPSLADKIDNAVEPAYYCTAAGKYGGNYYETGKNYRALAAYSAMSESDRAQFTFNYDALDLLIDPNYSRDPVTGNVIHPDRQKYQYDSAAGTWDGADANPATYSLQTPIDYSATYNGESPIDYVADDGSTVSTSVDCELTRTEYERLPNEQYHYAPITVGNTSDTYYVVKETIVLGDTPYAAGQVITQDTYNGLSGSDKEKVTSLTFTSTGTYYYCREAYTISNGDDGHAVTSATGVSGGTGDNGHQYAKNTEVPTGVIIDNLTYSTLTNKQKSFSIHGLAPTETSMLYVTRGSDIFDLSAEKIITVIYQYDYVESDMSGSHITPVSERHILNIHLNFKSGIPTVEDIQQPDIILPGTTIKIAEPYVTPGAYEITGGGWKLFDTETDAENHINGVEYTPDTDKLYLYQNKYWLAYYAKTYLGETYSNHVPVSVANYHDLKKVMDDKAHHYYIDHKNVHEVQKVEPKIYINDYSGSSENGLDLFKNLYDLSLLTTTPAESTDPLYGHNLLNERVKGGDKLEFFLRTDIDHPESWTAIGTDDVCFKGTLHGDGHTITGLDHSLFYNLCGDVYNLGVSGSFNTAGVVDKGTGYVESAWVKSTATIPLVTKPYAVFGNPTDATGYQVVNSYFCDDNSDLYNTTTTAGVTTSGGDRGNARAMTTREFYNGTVAYNLNNFYLHKRYANMMGAVDESDLVGCYFTIGDDGKLTRQPYRKYSNSPNWCSSGYVDNQDITLKYVEDRFADGDFRYDGGDRGIIPDTEDERYWVETVTTGNTTINKDHWSPIWPDDYIFFGQNLTYGYSAEVAHQDVPTAVTKSNGRLSQLSDANRVYRAPAYYRSKNMEVAHFNPHAYLAQKSKDGSKEAYPGMTAIDFAGYNDPDYKLGYTTEPWFYPSLLDDGGLLSIINCDETQNLLAYAPAETSTSGYANKATYDVLTGYFEDPDYGDYYSNDKYCKVADATPANSSIYGHLVKYGPIATNDHLLVDKQDFNCPIQYSFTKGKRMWYQRVPEDHEYVDLTKGWQGISIPFTAELVSANDKGEITHFYSGSETSKNGTDTKIGHEYWLRDFSSISVDETDPDNKVAKASFLYPTATGSNRTVENTFLWDYYYENTSVHNQKDANDDTYQTYYSRSRNYTSYPLLAAARPYIIGLPGETYYEFDLSGNFVAKNTAVAIDKLGKQVITFASSDVGATNDIGISIGVSDDEMAGVSYNIGNSNEIFTFKPSYMNHEMEAGTFVMNTDGNAYKALSETAATNTENKVSKTQFAFRPYFVKSAGSSNTRTIIFSNDQLEDKGVEEQHGDPTKEELNGGLRIWTKKDKIYVESSLKFTADMRVVTPAGITVATFSVKPGKTVEVQADFSGMYIVHTLDGLYTKKVTVRK